MKLPSFARSRARRLVAARPDLLRVIQQARRKAGSVGAATLRSVFDDLKTMLELAQAWAKGVYAGVDSATLVILVGAVVYFLMPVDLIPDFIPGLGFTDDAAVIASVASAVSQELARFRAREGGSVSEAGG